MCLAIYKPKGVQVARRYLRNGFENNPDGAGFAVCDGLGAVHVVKGFTDFKSFYAAFQPYENQTAIIHFRWATHGATDTENCHPFELIGGRFAVIHNGILNIACPNKEKSDTFHFAELVLTPMLARLEFDAPALKYLIETSIGEYNKLVILRGDGAHVIYNEKKGHWNKGAWFSNEDYKVGRAHRIVSGLSATWQAWTAAKSADASTHEEKESFPDYTPASAYIARREQQLNDAENATWESGDEEAESLVHWREAQSAADLEAEAEAELEAIEAQACPVRQSVVLPQSMATNEFNIRCTPVIAED